MFHLYFPTDRASLKKEKDTVLFKLFCLNDFIIIVFLWQRDYINEFHVVKWTNVILNFHLQHLWWAVTDSISRGWTSLFLGPQRQQNTINRKAPAIHQYAALLNFLILSVSINYATKRFFSFHLILWYQKSNLEQQHHSWVHILHTKKATLMSTNVNLYFIPLSLKVLCRCALGPPSHLSFTFHFTE